MFKVVLNDGQSEMPKDDVYYIIGKEGVYLKKKLGVMESLAPVDKISILESVTSMAKMHIEPIPGKWIAKVMGFFKAVYAEYKSEAIVLLFYNAETGKYKIVPPHQKVAGASCDYDKGITLENYEMIGTIHSHGSMSAFHSGTDDKDEEHFDGLHITLGDLDDEFPSISSSIVANGFRVMVEPSEYINNLTLMSEINPVEGKPVKTIYKIQDAKLVIDEEATAKFTTGYGYAYKKYDRRYGVLVSDRDRIFNKKWMAMVERGTFTYQSYRQQPIYGYGGAYGPHGWGQNYDSHAWGAAGRVITPPAAGTRVSPLNVGPASLSPLKFPAHTPEGDFVPCATCTHRLCKLTSEIEEDDFTNDELYQCIECGELVEDNGTKMELECTQCKTDAHLVLVDDNNLLDNYTPSDEYDHMFKKDQAVAESLYMKCTTCGNGFHKCETDTACPFCYTSLEGCSTEESLENQQNADSGSYLTPEQKESNDAALKAAREADATIVRIPEPGSKSTPLSKKKDTGLIAMFKNVFSREMDS